MPRRLQPVSDRQVTNGLHVMASAAEDLALGQLCIPSFLAP